MTIVTSNEPRNEYVASAGQTIFPYDYLIFADTDLKVLQNGTQLTLTTHYTVSGAGVEGGGNVTLVTGATLNDEIIIESDTPAARVTAWSTGGIIRAETLEDEFAKTFVLIKENRRDIGRKIGLAVDSTADPSTIIFPDPAANNFIGWDSAGTNLENKLAGDLSAITLPTGVSAGALLKAIDDTTYEASTATEDASGNWTIGGDLAVENISFSSTTEAGLNLNSLTTGERDALTPAAGMLIWNETTTQSEVYDGSAWVSSDATGTVTNIATGDGLTGGPITTTGTLAVDINSASTATVAGGDEVLIADVDDSNNIKKTTAQEIADLATATSGNRVLLETQTASADTSIDFTTGIDSTYDAYIIEMVDMVTATDAVDVLTRFSVSSTFQNTGYTDSTGATNGIKLNSNADTLGNASGEAMSGEMVITNPADSSLPCKARTNFVYNKSSDAVARSFRGGGEYATASAVDGFRIITSSGNITSGSFKLYGVVI